MFRFFGSAAFGDSPLSGSLTSCNHSKIFANNFGLPLDAVEELELPQARTGSLIDQARLGASKALRESFIEEVTETVLQDSDDTVYEAARSLLLEPFLVDGSVGSLQLESIEPRLHYEEPFVSGLAPIQREEITELCVKLRLAAERLGVLV